MRARNLLIWLSLGAVVIFCAANWPSLWVPATLWLLFTTVEAPLGLVMLCLLALVVAAFVVNLLVWQGQVLAESRRHTKELQQQRALATDAEASRLTQLQDQLRESTAELARRLDEVDARVRSELHEATNSMLATIAEMDDRLSGGRPREP